MKITISKQYYLIILLLLSFVSVNSQQIGSGKVQVSEIRSDQIKSLMMFREGWRLSSPITELGSDVPLILMFDDLSEDIKNYRFKIIHCNHDWTPSCLTEGKYLEGDIFQNYINEYDYSFNTYISYVHYELKLPNDDISFKVSGNYIIQVYEDYNEEEIIFSHRFMLSEKQVQVTADISRPILSLYRNNSQQINVSVNYSSFPVNNPFNDIKLVILQNGRWDNALTGLKPLFDKNGILDYNYQMENVFPGGNEFRWFDIKSLRYQSPYIKSIEYTNDHHEVHLFPEKDRSQKQYFYEEDLNGKYFIEIQEEDNNDTDADYVYVYFNYPQKSPVYEKDLYILGNLSLWGFTDKNKMEYDNSDNSYKLKLLLKQGYYNYQIAALKSETKVADLSFTEGNHFETENDYTILVYYKDVRDYYDRLIGYQISNSIRK